MVTMSGGDGGDGGDGDEDDVDGGDDDYGDDDDDDDDDDDHDDDDGVHHGDDDYDDDDGTYVEKPEHEKHAQPPAHLIVMQPASSTGLNPRKRLAMPYSLHPTLKPML